MAILLALIDCDSVIKILAAFRAWDVALTAMHRIARNTGARPDWESE